ncbi:hypothetical protein [Nocardia sp. NPDC058666]|uniref:hypothetical protein n=1 Tax=Nocardia sp. NPDC058666 TaxID=3346587 RepID=UPI0036596C17
MSVPQGQGTQASKPDESLPELFARIRVWYNDQQQKIPELNAQWKNEGVPLRERAQRAQGIRHEARLGARELMPEDAVEDLRHRDASKYNGNPDGPTFDSLVAKNMAEGYTGDAVYEQVIGSSTRTDSSFNKANGLAADGSKNPSKESAAPPSPIPGRGPSTPHRDQLKNPSQLGNLAGKAKAAPLALGGKVKRAVGRTAAMAGDAAGMLPQFAGAASDPTAFVQGMAGTAPDAAMEMLQNAGEAGFVQDDAVSSGGDSAQTRGPRPGLAQPSGDRVAGNPDTRAKGGPTASMQGAQSVSGAVDASAAAMKKSTDAAKGQSDAMKKSAEAVKGASDGMKRLSTEASKSVGAQKNAADATKSMAGAQKNLNTSMKGGVFGTIVTVIGLVISGVMLLIQHWDKVKVGFDWVFKNVLTPIGKWFSDIWAGTLAPMFKSSIDSISGVFSGMGSAVTGVLDGIMDKVRFVVGIIANVIGSLPEIKFLGVSTKDVASKLHSFASPDKKADGGKLSGPGGPRDDVIPVLASNGEFIVNAASTSQNLPLLEAINSGAVPRFADGGVVHSEWSSLLGSQAQSAVGRFFFGSTGEPAPTKDGKERTGWDYVDTTAKTAFAGAASSFMSGMFGDALGVFGIDRIPPAFQAIGEAKNLIEADRAKSTEAASGDEGAGDENAEVDDQEQPTSATPAGMSDKTRRLIEFAQGVDGAPYVWGGVNWGDCSGAVSALANFAAGWPEFGSRFATGNQEEALRARGANSGLGPTGSLNIGWYHNGGGDGHTAATLPNGVNFEMGGARGNGQYGKSAAGAHNGQFTHHAHFPPEVFMAAGGSVFGPGSSIGDMVPAWLSDGEFVVNAKSADANRSLLETINQDAGALANLVGHGLVPTKALADAGGGESVDQSTAIHLSTPDVDTAYQKAKTFIAQRGLSYVGRFG